ncbi:MAG: NAD(P)/FAD-dependent oxidoreductase [Desulfatibacillaceae bacterium]
MPETDTDKTYDAIIIGGGPAGMFAAFHLAEHSSLSVLLLEKGPHVGKRRCPRNETNECKKCRQCHILSGMGGAGLFSDGKLNFIHRLGKTDLTEFMPEPQAMELIRETEGIFDRFGMTGQVYPTDMARAHGIRTEARKQGVNLLIIRQKHLGSDRLPTHISKFVEHLSQRVDIRTGEEAVDILTEGDTVVGVRTDSAVYHARNVILAPGRVGAEWVGGLARRHGIRLFSRGIEVGVRVEVHSDVMADLCGVIYDPTFFVQTSKYDDQTRTFCTNQGGYVTTEHYRDFVCVNGHAYMDRKSENTNFAFLSKVVLNDPVTDNQSYGESIGRLATLIGAGKPILQRFGDLLRGRRSTWRRIRNSFVEPSLTSVVCGDIAMALPERILTNVVQGLEKLNGVVPGVANDETLLYAPEIKFFATQVECDNHLQTKIAGLYVAGDGPGVAGNIVSASATGLIPAKHIVERLG